MVRAIIWQADPADVWLDTKGTYRIGKSEGELTATMSCPKCGHRASLSAHTIEKGGLVSPSVVCPADDCDFHEYVRLQGWDGLVVTDETE